MKVIQNGSVTSRQLLIKDFCSSLPFFVHKNKYVGFDAVLTHIAVEVKAPELTT